MKTCSVCRRILPRESFPADQKLKTGLSSWCGDCYRVKRQEWKRANRAHTSSWKEEERGKKADPIQWAGLHCRHISQYITRVVTRFESKTGLEAPPQLIAIRQLADQMSTQLPQREKARPGHVCCRNCGREFSPRKRGKSIYCSPYCRGRFKKVSKVMEAALTTKGDT